MREVQKETIAVSEAKPLVDTPEDSSPSGDTRVPLPGSSLLEMNPGEKGVIERIEPGRPEVRQRLLEMGLVSGTTIECVRFAPLGDPLQVRIDRTNVSMRRAEARLVVIRRSV